MINTHNWEMEHHPPIPPGGVHFWPRNDEILDKLSFLEEELPKAVKYLRQGRR